MRACVDVLITDHRLPSLTHRQHSRSRRTHRLISSVVNDDIERYRSQHRRITTLDGRCKQRAVLRLARSDTATTAFASDIFSLTSRSLQLEDEKTYDIEVDKHGPETREGLMGGRQQVED